MSDLAAKRDRLLAILREMPRAVVAFSGGIDSTVVAQAAFTALGDRAVAVTSDSPSVPRAELALAVELARRIGISHRVVQTEEFENADYLRNDGARCYFCKDELYSQIEKLLPEFEPAVVCSGANLDDRGDYRPGLTAAAEHHVRHPLLFPSLKRPPRTRITVLDNKVVGDKVSPRLPFLVVQKKIAPHIHVLILIAMREQVINPNHPHSVHVSFAHRLAVRFWINDLGGTCLDHVLLRSGDHYSCLY